jgi:hypothetical protein
MPKGEIVGKCLTGSVCLSLMASTTVKMAGSGSVHQKYFCEDSAEAQKSKNPLGISEVKAQEEQRRGERVQQSSRYRSSQRRRKTKVEAFENL